MWREGDEGEEGDAGRREGSCREGKGESESETEKGLAEPPRFDCVLQNDKVPKYCKINTSYPSLGGIYMFKGRRIWIG